MKLYKIFIGTVLLFTSCVSSETKNTEESITEEDNTSLTLNEDQIGLAGIRWTKPQVRKISKSLTLNGFLEAPPQNVISIIAPLGGFIKSTPLLQGMHIHKGDLLATVEDIAYIQLQEDYLRTKEELNLANKEQERQTLLFQGEATSEKTNQAANSRVNQLLIQINSLAEKLRLCGIEPESLSPSKMNRKIEIRSTANAFVKSVHMNMGKYVGAQDVLAELIDTDHLHVELTAYEQDVPKLKEGQKFSFHMVNSPNDLYSGHIYLVGKALGEGRSVQIHGHLDDEKTTFIPGNAVLAEIELGSDSLLSIESSAIFNLNDKPHVFLKKGKNEIQIVSIEIEKESANYTAIKTSKEINSESELVIEGIQSLKGMMFNEEEE